MHRHSSHLSSLDGSARKRPGRAQRGGLSAVLLASLLTPSFGMSDYERPAPVPPAAACASGRCSSSVDPGRLRDVHLSTGELKRSWVDLRFPGRGIDFVWTRTYRSKSDHAGAMGGGWDHGYNLTYQVVDEGLLVSDGTGRQDLMTLDEEERYTSPDLNRVAEFDGSGNLVVRFPDLVTWTFAPDSSGDGGRIVEISERNGNALSFQYDAQERLSNVTDSVGRKFKVLYDQRGRLSAVSGPTGREVTYTYQAAAMGATEVGQKRAWNLVAVTSPAVIGTPTGNDFPSGLTTTFKYQDSKDPALRHNLESVTDPTGTTTELYDYTDVSNPADRSYDRVNEIYDPSLGGRMQFHHEPSDDVVAGTSKSTVYSNDGVGNVIEYDFDSLNRLIAKREFTGRADPNLPTTATSNRPTGKLRPSDPDYFQTLWTWNAWSYVTLEIHPNGNQTRRVYEVDLNPAAGPLSLGNLREQHREPGSHTPVGDQPTLTELWEYNATFGGCCGGDFITKYTDEDGFVTEHSYDANGNRVQTITLVDGATTDHVYNANGQKIQTTHPTDWNGDRRVDVFTYHTTGGGMGLLRDTILDANGLALTETAGYDAWGNKSERIDANGNSILVTYNALGYPVQEQSQELTRPDGSTYRVLRDMIYDAAMRPSQMLSDNLDEEGAPRVPARNSTILQYNGSGHLTRFTVQLGVGDSMVTEYSYDANGQCTLVRKGEAVAGTQPHNERAKEWDERKLLFKTIEAPSSPEKSTNQRDYDANGNLARIITGLESGGRTTSYVMDAYDRTILRSDPRGGIETTNYDARSNVVHTVFVGDSQDITSTTPERLSESWTTFDGRDRRVQEQIAHFAADQAPVLDGTKTTTWSFAPNHDLISETRDDGGVLTFEYDSADRLVKTNLPSGDSMTVLLDNNGNELGILEQEINEVTGATETFSTSQSFDPRDLMVSRTDNAGQTESFAYDSVENLVLEIDARGNRVEHTFDGSRRPLSSSRILTDTGDGAGNVIGAMTVSQAWDKTGRRVSLTDGEGNTTLFAYDALDRLIVRQKADGAVDQIGKGATWVLGASQPNLASFQSGWDAHGDAVNLTFATGSEVISTFNEGGLTVQRSIVPGPAVAGDTTVEFMAWDGLGRLVATANDNHQTSFLFDSLGRKTKDSVDGLTNTALYDGMGRQLGLGLVTGRVMVNDFDTNGRLRKVSSGPSTLATYDYVGPRLARRDFGNGTWTVADYDADRRVTRTSNEGSSGVFDEHVYGWDAASNKTFWSDNLGNGPTWSFSYDSANQLVSSVDGLGSLTAITLDQAGNRTQQVGGVGAGPYVLDPALPTPADKQVNQYTATPAGSRTYSASGSTLTLQSGGRSLVMSYDYRDRLVSATDVLGNYSETYSYDVLGRRCRKTVTDGTNVTQTLYSHFQHRIVAEGKIVNGALTTVIEYAHGSGLDELVCLWTNQVQSYVHTDDTLSVTSLTDVTGKVFERYNYGLAGEPTILNDAGMVLGESSVGNTAMYQGLRYDSGTGLFQNRMRYYDPVAGCFLTADPKGAFFDPLSFGNGKTRAANSPWTWSDPMGWAASSASSGPDTDDIAIALTVAGALVTVAGVVAGGPFVAALGASIAIHAAALAVAEWWTKKEWCIMIVSKTAKGGPEKDDKWCYECPEDGKCPGTIKLIEWEGKKMDVEFKKDTDVCIDDCGYQILRIYAASNQSVNIDSSLEMRDSAMSGDTQSSSFQNN